MRHEQARGCDPRQHALAGTYNQAFEPIIKTLARIQTELAKAERDWRANGGEFVTEYTNKSGATNAVKDPYYSVVEGLRGQIVDISAQLGLTPTGQRRVLGNAKAAPSGPTALERALAEARERAGK